MSPTISRPSVLAFVLALSTIGCSSSPPSRFYHLAPSDGAGGGADGGLAVVLEPVRMAQVVDRPQIVTVSDTHTRKMAEFSRWAEPLPANVSAVLAENLVRRLGTDRVSVLPSKLAERPDVQVAVDVIRFDATLGGHCSLVALWALRDGSGGWLVAGRTECEADAAGDDYAALVAAMSDCLATLSDALAAEIRAHGSGA